MRSEDTPTDVDKQTLWGWWYRQAAWRDQLDKRLAHKALDIPEADDMQNVGNRSGMTWRELAVIGVMVLGAGWIAANHMSATQQTAPEDSEYEVRFFDAEGNPVDVPHVSRRPP